MIITKKNETEQKQFNCMSKLYGYLIANKKTENIEKIEKALKQAFENFYNASARD